TCTTARATPSTTRTRCSTTSGRVLTRGGSRPTSSPAACPSEPRAWVLHRAAWRPGLAAACGGRARLPLTAGDPRCGTAAAGRDGGETLMAETPVEDMEPWERDVGFALEEPLTVWPRRPAPAREQPPN